MVTWMAWKLDVNSRSQICCVFSSGMAESSWCSRASRGFLNISTSPLLACFISRSTNSVTCNQIFLDTGNIFCVRFPKVSMSKWRNSTSSCSQACGGNICEQGNIWLLRIINLINSNNIYGSLEIMEFRLFDNNCALCSSIRD